MDDKFVANANDIYTELNNLSITAVIGYVGIAKIETNDNQRNEVYALDNAMLLNTYISWYLEWDPSFVYFKGTQDYH